MSGGGQLTGWLNLPEQEKTELGLRYIPEFFWSAPEYALDIDLALNGSLTSGADSKLKIHRLWSRWSTAQMEIRFGLQKVNFGSATLFRPLQWFDTLDPLDPLGFTESVKGLLLRYYLPNNANFWLWGLYGNDELKGPEIVPAKKQDLEFGGRLQLPVFNGEAGLTYHQRRLDFGRSPTFSMQSDEITPERRIGLDGKWDLGIGIWLEAAHIAADIDNKFLRDLYLENQYHSTIGADYTFDLGNGLHVLIEKYNLDTDLYRADRNHNTQAYGALADYPVGLYDTVSVIQYYAKKNDSLSLRWQRTYDDWVWQFLATAAPDYTAQKKTTGALQVLLSYNY
ncbi:hypothetical protein NO1_0219 [Candidatus Termititenax aidoneus]|uniref:Uncharacterized protein n=1 Tax=Termititenax aidoneus TaxID=2218524 RepID=A0A388T875_TERA1|nr:hypothetical protein NO1_0219 [Candidatus Termititenax aidoneus]